jgi:hypothetical protein
MSDRWESLLIVAKPLVSFIEEGKILSQPYNGETEKRILVYDQHFARSSVSDPPPEGFYDWEESTEGPGILGEHFEGISWIDKKLLANNFFNVRSNNPSLEMELRDADAQGGLLEFVERDVRILLHCYAYGCFPPIWKLILDAYLHYGFPCGWSKDRKLAILCRRNPESG